MYRVQIFLNDIWLGFKSSPLLFFLVFSTIAAGAACSAGLIGVVRGLQLQEERLISALGANVFAITYHLDGRRGADDTAEDTFNILRGSSTVFQSSITRSARVDVAGVRHRINLLQADSNLALVQNWEVSKGRFFDPVDIDSRARVAVVSQHLADEFGWQPGAVLMISNQPYRVIGILTANELKDQPVELNGLSFHERSVLIPLTIIPHWMSEQNTINPSVLTLFVRMRAGQDISKVARQLRNYLTGTNISMEELSWITPAELTAGITKLKRAITVSFGTLAILLLLVAMVTLFASLANSVRIRFSEIGLRRALGARRVDIASMFVLEGALVSFVGALSGISFVLAVVPILNRYLSVPMAVDGWMFYLPLLFYVALGGFSSLWPARVAAGLSPARCLRV